MSGLVVGLTLAHLPTDSHSLLSVALVLADQADQRGENVFPSVPLVAVLARLSERQVQYSMRDLNDLGFLVLVKKGGGRGNPTKWRIDLEWLKAKPDLVSMWRNGAQTAPIPKTVQKRCTDESDKAQKGCTNGAPATAPDPTTHDPVYPTTHGYGGDVDFTLAELLDATALQLSTQGHKLGAGLVDVISDRYHSGRCNARDISAVGNFRARKETEQKLVEIKQKPPAIDLQPVSAEDVLTKKVWRSA